MSNSASPDRYAETSDSADDERDDDRRGDDRLLEAVAPTYASPVRKTGFWGAIVLPVLYLPLLATGLSTGLEAGLFLGLLGANLAALYVGHAHRR